MNGVNVDVPIEIHASQCTTTRLETTSWASNIWRDAWPSTRIGNVHGSYNKYRKPTLSKCGMQIGDGIWTDFWNTPWITDSDGRCQIRVGSPWRQCNTFVCESNKATFQAPYVTTYRLVDHYTAFDKLEARETVRKDLDGPKGSFTRSKGNLYMIIGFKTVQRFRSRLRTLAAPGPLRGSRNHYLRLRPDYH